MQLDDNLKQLMKELGAAINDALSDSEEISEAIQNVRNAGYDVFLVLEATIGFACRNRSVGPVGRKCSGYPTLNKPSVGTPTAGPICIGPVSLLISSRA